MPPQLILDIFLFTGRETTWGKANGLLQIFRKRKYRTAPRLYTNVLAATLMEMLDHNVPSAGMMSVSPWLLGKPWLIPMPSAMAIYDFSAVADQVVHGWRMVARLATKLHSSSAIWGMVSTALLSWEWEHLGLLPASPWGVDHQHLHTSVTWSLRYHTWYSTLGYVMWHLDFWVSLHVAATIAKPAPDVVSALPCWTQW